VLSLDASNTVVLNNLAWILATTKERQLRDGWEAVRLASQAVDLTDRREPVLIGTLAAAYAEEGHFDEAIVYAQLARCLALLTDQQEVAARNAQLLNAYLQGKAVGG
jgi:hypothetical protein